MKRTIGYIRVSTGRQAESGLSLEAQEHKIRQMAAFKELTIDEIVVDAAESAARLDRPGMQRILNMARAGELATVIAAKLDRLTRSVRDLAELVDIFNEHDVAMISVTETLDTSTAAGRMMLNVLATVAQWELETIRERTRDALRQKKLRGELTGCAPFGMRVAADGIHLIPDPREQQVLAEIAGLRAAGLSMERTCASLNARGMFTRKGKPWVYQDIQNIERRRKAA